MAGQGTIIVTGTSQGIGAGVVRGFLERGYNVVANWRNTTNSGAFRVSDRLSLVAAKIVAHATTQFGSISALVNNAGIFFGKPSTEFTAEDLEALSTVNLKGFLDVTQGSVKQMPTQKRGGSIVSITASQVVNPIAGVLASVPMITKGRLEDVTGSVASECARGHIRLKAVAPGIVDSPMHANNSKDFLTTLSPMGTISSVSDVVHAVVYPTEARNTTGLGAARGRWCPPGALVRLTSPQPPSAESRFAVRGIEPR